ncbi:hypothetical protein PMG11_10389 [Penicillium brasilianum]|uniref:Zn(2)-C6 fungal-type domain-containing protein n=1 Tax=Penicillium brasilianum TaxID=104259 RepID=A0A0F7TZ16_PENBI|nr:hypothetical protein PMG11_10389 [Penicillium brasilianum]
MPLPIKPSRKRSKTGCRTCRIKCDETPVACRNCTSAGQRFDGYDSHRLPPKLKLSAKYSRKFLEQNDIEPVLGSLDWAVTSDERRSLSYFQFHTVPTLLGFFDSLIWQKLVLQLSQSEPPVYHAVVAISAIHENCEANGMPLAAPAPHSDNPWQQFAQDQLARSIKLLNQRRTSQDPRLRHTILVCCLLFVLADLLRGFYESAFSHLQSGLCILRDSLFVGPHTSLIPRPRTLNEQCLIEAFGNLDILAAHYDCTFPILPVEKRLRSTPSNTLPPSSSSATQFHSIAEARIAFDALLSESYKFSAPTMGMTDEQVAANYSTLRSQQHQVWGQMNLFATSFRPFYKTAHRELSLKDQRSADIINIHLVSLPVCLKSCLLGKNFGALAEYTAELKRVCDLVEDLMAKFPVRPSFTLEAGILPPLYLSALLCVDYRVRWRAIQLMRSWPHREGPFDSNWLASLAEESLRLDLLTQCTNNVTDQHTDQQVSRNGSISGPEMLQRLSAIRKEKVDMMLRTRRLHRDAEFDVLDAVGLVEGMGSLSCVRAFTSATSKFASWH